MARKPRIDAPGALHHVICRGIERRRVFDDDAEWDNLVERLGPTVLKETSRPCYGWSLLSNHFHCSLIFAEGFERILGDSDFVKRGTAEKEERFERRYWLWAHGCDIDRVVEKVAEVFGIEPSEVRKAGNQSLRPLARRGQNERDGIHKSRL